MSPNNKILLDELEYLEGALQRHRARGYRMANLAKALLENFNGDLVKVWRENEAALRELGYKQEKL